MLGTQIKSPAFRRGHELSVLGEPTNQLKLSANQLATEHSSDTHKSCSEKTQGSRFRCVDLRDTRMDVPDTLAELFVVKDKDGLLCRSSNGMTVPQLARDCSRHSVRFKLPTHGSQSPTNVTSEAAGEDYCIVSMCPVALANHVKR